MKMKKIVSMIGTGAAIALLSFSAHANLLTNPGFDAQDVSGGDAFGSTGWTPFGSAFTTSNGGPAGGAIPAADSPNNVAKAFGAGAGMTQSFAASEGDVFTMSGLAQDFVIDSLGATGTLRLQLVFRDINGAFAGTAAGGNFAPGFNVFDSNLVEAGNPTDNVWTLLGVGTAPAPDNTASVDFNILVLSPAGGAGYFDSIVAEQVVVPVPAAVWLFGSGLLGLVGVARRRKS